MYLVIVHTTWPDGEKFPLIAEREDRSPNEAAQAGLDSIDDDCKIAGVEVYNIGGKTRYSVKRASRWQLTNEYECNEPKIWPGMGD